MFQYKKVIFLIKIQKDYPQQQYIMKLFFYTIVLLSVVSAMEWFEEGDPHMLVGSNFNTTLKDNTHCKFIKFFTPWCRFCRVLKAIIDEHKQTTYANSTDVKFYEVNCHQSPDICMPLEVYSVPFVMFVNKEGQKKSTSTGVYPKQWYVNMISTNCETKQEQKKAEENNNSEIVNQTKTDDADTNKDQKDKNTQKSKSNLQKETQAIKQEQQKKPNQNQSSNKQSNAQNEKVQSKTQSQTKNTQTQTKDLNKQKGPAISDPKHELPSSKNQVKPQTLLPQQVVKNKQQITKANGKVSSLKSQQLSTSEQSSKSSSFKSILIVVVGLVIGIILHNKYCSADGSQQHPI